MRPSGTENLVPVLGQCATLTHLNLSGNLIEPKGILSLGRVLGHFTALVQLDLSDNVIGPEGAQILVGVLLDSTTLAQLDLNFIDVSVLRVLGAHRRGRNHRRHSA
jgi:Ran GTPase-activating protein (RanGAP) involved in mRNA processing and transport